MTSSAMTTTTLDPDGTAGRVALLDWERIAADLDGHGCAVIGPLLTPEQCAELAASYDDDGLFRSRVVMERHGYGRGEYRYFSYTLPEAASTLRATAFPPPRQRVASPDFFLVSRMA